MRAEIEAKCNSELKTELNNYVQSIKEIKDDEIDKYNTEMCEKLTTMLKDLNHKYKYIVNGCIFIKNNILINLNSSCLWDPELDFSMNISVEKGDYVFLYNIYAIALD